MKRLVLGQLKHEWAPPAEPVLKVSPGETFIVETEDCWGGQIMKADDWPEPGRGNPTVSGSILVEGAEKGDVLTVDVMDVQPLRGQGATRINVPNLPRLKEGPLAELGRSLPPPSRWVRICPVRDGRVYWTERLALSYEPMIGTIGTFEESGKGANGGNMDVREVTVGSRLHLPVSVDGAYLYLGDVHAAQGEGELCGTAVEMAAVVTLKVGLVKNKAIGGPRIESKDYLTAVGMGRPVEDAIEAAFRELLLWLEEYGINRWEGYNLCTHVAEISIGWYLTCFAGAKFPRKYLPSTP